MKFDLKLLQEDKRGSVHLLEFLGCEYLLIYTKAGYCRGGEIHIGQQTNMLIDGQSEWWIAETRKDYYAEKLVIPSHTPHMMYAKTDCLMVEWREYPLENPVVYYEPFRKIVEAKKE